MALGKIIKNNKWFYSGTQNKNKNKNKTNTMSDNNKNKKSTMPGLKKQKAKKLKKKEKLQRFLDEQMQNTWFDAKSGVHLVRKGDVIVPDRGYLKALKHPMCKITNNKGHMVEVISQLDAQIKYEKSIQYHGAIAGQCTGKLARCGGSDWLVTSSPELIEPVKGEFPLIKRLVETMLPGEAPQLALYAWLKTQLQAITSGFHSKCPMLILAGDADDGKSFFMRLATILRGGREINPVKAWSKNGLPWSDHMLKVECLNIDDSLAEKDYASREALGTNFKESCFADAVTINQRNHSSFSPEPRPVWGVMMAVNANGRAIRVVPAVDEEGMVDKVVILRTQRADIYLRDHGDAANKKRLAAYMGELPAFAYWLQEEFCVSTELPLGCSLARSGAVIYRDKEAMNILHNESPAGQLEDLLREFIEDAFTTLEPTFGSPKQPPITIGEKYYSGPLLASKIRWELLADGKYKSDNRIPPTNLSMGKYLGQIADREGSCMERVGKNRDKISQWKFIPPTHTECAMD